MDYYRILGLEATKATSDDIAKAYREKAMASHPMKNSGNLAQSQIEFDKLCEAYQVLSDGRLKSTFDMHGEDGLKNGVGKRKGGKTIGSYTYQGNSIEIFEAFFGSKNPFTNNFAAVQEEVKAPSKDDCTAEIKLTLDCTIYEFYNGSLKQVEFQRDELMPDGKSR